MPQNMPPRGRTCHGPLALLGAFCLCVSAPVLVRAKAVYSDTGASLAASGSEPLPSAHMGPPPQLLSGEGRREWDSLSPKAKLEANKELRAIVIRPKDADVVHFSATGHLFFADPMPKIPVEKMSSAGRRRRRALSDTAPLRFQPNGLPIYHSSLGAPNTIYLNFEGTTRAKGESIWGVFSNAGYNPTGDSDTFSAFEQEEIGLIWGRVAEDYAPFNVDVTTEEPNIFTSRTLHCLIADRRQTNGVLMPYADRAAGIAYVSIFNKQSTKYLGPAFVYWNNLANGRNDYVAEAASHEIGHNLGLSHDGTSSSAYSSGDGDASDPVSWAPIMGAAYENSVSQWSDGQYQSANNLEDDISILRSQLGRRADEAGETPQSASSVNLIPDSGIFTAAGVIDASFDNDWWQISVPGTGMLVALAEGWSAEKGTAGGNLDIRLRLLDFSGKVITTSEPSGRTSASLERFVTPGTYYVEISSSYEAGRYTAYGSLGQYDLAGRIPAAAETCKVDADCANDGLYCNGEFICRKGACLESNNDPCPAPGQICIEETRSCTMVTSVLPATEMPEDLCPADDQYESNERYEDAAPVSANGELDAVLCPDNVDWYSVELCPGSTLEVAFLFEHVQGDVDAALWYNGKFIAISDSPTDNEKLLVTNMALVTLTVHVYVYGDGQVSAPYTMRRHLSGGVCNGQLNVGSTTTTAKPRATTNAIPSTTADLMATSAIGLEPGELQEVLGCTCTATLGETTAYTRLRLDGLFAFCIEHLSGNRQAWGRVRAKPPGQKFDMRAETTRLNKGGETTCALYRPRVGEEDAMHELRLKRRRNVDAILRY